MSDVTTNYLKSKDLNGLGDEIMLCHIGYATQDVVIQLTNTATGTISEHMEQSDANKLITWDVSDINFVDGTYQISVFIDGEETSMLWDWDEHYEDYNYTTQVLQARFKYHKNESNEYIEAATQEVEIDAV